MHRSFLLVLLPAIVFASGQYDIIRQLLNDYDKYEPPRRDGATEVKVGIYINDIEFRDKKATVTMYLRQGWNDPRLAHSDIRESIRLYHWDQIWVPDTFFHHDLGSFVHEQTVPNRLMKLSKTGDIWYVMKLSMTQRIFPTEAGDIASLPMQVESFGYTADTMYFSAMGSHPLAASQELVLPDGMQLLEDRNIQDCSMNYTVGSFTCLKFELKFQGGTA